MVSSHWSSVIGSWSRLRCEREEGAKEGGASGGSRVCFDWAVQGRRRGLGETGARTLANPSRASDFAQRATSDKALATPVFGCSRCSRLAGRFPVSMAKPEREGNGSPMWGRDG